jgi:hypothetical protein
MSQSSRKLAAARPATAAATAARRRAALILTIWPGLLVQIKDNGELLSSAFDLGDGSETAE